MDSSSSSTDTLLKFLAWLDKNKKRVGLITGATLAAAALIFAIVYYQSQKEERASDALSNVRRPANPTAAPPPGTVEADLKVAQEFSGTKAAGRALLDAASLLYLDGNYTNAEAHYKRFLSEYPDSPFLQQGMLGLASTLDAEGKTTNAIAKYEELRRRFPADSVIDETKLALGRLYEKQNPAEAYKLYTEIVTAGAQSGIGSEAGIRLEDLLERHPELVKTNAPTATVTPAAQPTPQISMVKSGATNQMVMTITNAPNRTSTSTAAASRSITGAVQAATGAAPNTPLLLKPTLSTNASAKTP